MSAPSGMLYSRKCIVSLSLSHSSSSCGVSSPTHHLACSLLNSPEGVDGGREVDVGGVPTFILHVTCQMSHPSLFMPHLLTPSLKQAIPEGQLATAAVSLHNCIFTTHSSLCHTLPLSLISFFFFVRFLHIQYALPI